MYNDEKNLYHYTYRKDGSEQPGENLVNPQSVPGSDNEHRENVQEMKPVKKNRLGIKIAALCLCCALLGGAVGGGVAWAASGSSTSINVSSRPATEVAIKTVDGKTEMTDAEVYAANVNSVVSINTTATAGTNFFGQPVQTASAGSGFVLTADGYIVTNYHVVEDADTVTVTMYNGDEYDAKYVGGDEDYDIAVIKVEAQDLQPVTVGDSDTLNVGDHVLAVGNPLGELTFSMSGGMVSSVNRAINVSGTPFNMIQTDASINPGNSGGALINKYGQVIGITSAKLGISYYEGLGFAIPIDSAKDVVDQIIAYGHVKGRPAIGVTGYNLSKQSVEYNGVPQGVVVTEVDERSDAAAKGLQLSLIHI